MNNFNIRREPVASLVWEKDEGKGKTTKVGVVEYESDTGDVIVKIVTDDRSAGIPAEYAFIRYKYPGYAVNMQSLIRATINGKHIMCDRLRINNGTDEKHVFFDISDFY